MKTTYVDRLHPAVAFGYFVAAIVMSVLHQHPIYLGLSILGAVALNISISGLRFFKKILAFLPLAVMVAIINPLFNILGKTVLFSLWGRPYTLEALYYGMAVGGMLLGMLLWFSAYNRVMTDDKFTYLFGSLSPALSLLLTTVFRMIPNLTRKLRQIMDARKCIGMAGGDHAKDKLKSGVTAISVLTSWALEGGITTADSMNCRGYGTAKRTGFHSYRFTGTDTLVAVALLGTWVYTAAVLLSGGAAAEFVPTVHLAPVHPIGVGAYLIFLLLPTIFNGKEALWWHFSRSKI